MKFDLSRLRWGPSRPDVVDGRGQTFFAGPVVTIATDGQTPRAGELLHALPMVKVEGAAANSSGRLAVLVKRAGGPFAAAGWYASTTVLPVLPASPSAEIEVLLARVGYRLQTLVIDDRATPDGTAHREAYWKVLTAAYAVLRELNTAIARGDGLESPVPRIVGLKKLSSTSGRTVALSSPTANLEPYVRRALGAVTPNDCGPGGGPDCLIGNARMLRRLMATSAGQSGSSGWREDPVSGQRVFCYMGIPFYRADVEVETTGNPNTSRLYAANLGPTGLNLVHAHGTPGSFGLEADDISNTAGVGATGRVVHGAYALALWESEALFEVSNIDVGGDP